MTRNGYSLDPPPLPPSPASAARPYPVLATVYIRLHSSDNGIATEMFLRLWDGDREGAMSLVSALASGYYSDYGTRAGFLLSSPPRIQ